ncbi:uncharacterized mitochondrial protein AtMg00310-like [Hibiscus syriacus]|uniref:uncharacterized mitochondrial protein AtMg00310-like n=1 Tax=Hibiscus syriacus TaxID=106335 RepID=UPI001923640D|nr:uncharacterized mitochondrial protein AtMg00310-like [Hibiscus syriacus]
MLKRVSGWQQNIVSYGGREVYIKLVGQAIPTYAMGCFLLPSGVITDLTQVMRDYWWSGRSDAHRWPLLVWSSICQPKRMGDLGFRELHAFNLDLLGKQLWRLMRTPNSLVSRVLAGKYYPGSSVWTAQPSNRPSYAWLSLYVAKASLQPGYFWKPGIESGISMFQDSWGGSSPIQFSTKHIDNVDALNERLVRQLFPISEATAILQCPGIAAPSPLWLFLSRLPILPKVRVFDWRFANDALPVGARLLTVGLSDGHCPIRGVHIETALHAIREWPEYRL